jgi:5-methylcytosine-specific restriction protein A
VPRLHVCATAGCPALTDRTYCASCRPAIARLDREQRGTSWARGYRTRWRKLRAVVLARDPICTICQQAPSEAVDHIVPVAPNENPEDVEVEDLRGLCWSCHSRRHAIERSDAHARVRK